MASNYPPQGPGQPNQLPYGPPSGQPGGPPMNYGSPYGQPSGQPYAQPGQPPQYSQPNNQPYGQPSDVPQNYNQPPAAPTQAQGYGTPPPGSYYGPPPGNAPYSGPQQAARPPYPPQTFYPAQPVVKSDKRKAKSRAGGFISLGIIAVIVVIAVVLGVLGVFNNVDATDYPNSTRATLTDKGNAYVNDLYDNKKSDTDNRKVFLTADTSAAIFKYYQDDLVKKGWKFDEAGILENVPAYKFSKNSKLLYVIVGDESQGMVQNAAGKNFIILLTGDKV